VINTLSGYKFIKSYVADNEMFRRLQHVLTKYRKIEMRLTFIESVFKGIYEPLVIIVAVLVYAMHPEYSIATFIVFLIALNKLYVKVKLIQNTHYKISHHYGSLRMYEELEHGLDKRQYDYREGGVSFRDLNDCIKFSNVKYVYSADENAFSLGPIHLNIKKGQRVALVGRSGSGKTTCVDLLEGLLVPNVGSIHIDDKEIGEYDMDSLRRRIGYVTQDVFLLNDTLKENIKFFDNAISDDEVFKSCELALVSEYLDELPDGLDTVLGEHGARLSGGQRQRICLARALVRNPTILILDEATSALDNQAEKMIQRSIDNLSRDITVVIIAHRLSTVRNADYIYYFDAGNIVEQGTFDELVKCNGEFAALHNAGIYEKI